MEHYDFLTSLPPRLVAGTVRSMVGLAVPRNRSRFRSRRAASGSPGEP